MKRITTFALLMALVAGCGAPKPDAEKKPEDTKITKGAGLPVFTVATSEYPSWSTLIVAGKAGLVNPEKGGKSGPLEEKWGVDLVIEVKDYDPCLTLYAGTQVDAVCITNVDALNPALGRPSTFICPTSTSVGGDKVIGVGLDKAEDLKGVKTYGLAKSVSQFVFVRCLQKRGLNPADHPFENLDPAAAATALQSGTGEIKSICVWNPYALQTLRLNDKSKSVMSSADIPEEVIDGIVVGNDALEKEGGANFACLLCDTFYSVCKLLTDPDQKKADATLTAIGEDFSKLPLEDMRIVIKDTSFYLTANDGKGLFDSPVWRDKMETVVKTCHLIEVLPKDKAPTIGFDDPAAQLNFTTKYMDAVSKK